MITTTRLEFTYDDGQGFRFPDIDLKPGEHLLILGPSGVGKTTLLHLLSGLLPPASGSITIDGTPISAMGRKDLDRYRGAHIGLVFQQYHFVNALNVAENLALRQQYPKKELDQERRQQLAHRLGLEDHLNKRVTQLSQGQQQRLAIALGLIHKPKVVFADEPTANLDDHNTDKVISLLKDEADRCGSSLIIITHDQRLNKHFANKIVL